MLVVKCVNNSLDGGLENKKSVIVCGASTPNFFSIFYQYILYSLIGHMHLQNKWYFIPPRRIQQWRKKNKIEYKTSFMEFGV